MTGPEELLKEVLLLTAVGDTMSLQAEHPIQGQFFHFNRQQSSSDSLATPLLWGRGIYATWYEDLYVWENVCEMT